MPEKRKKLGQSHFYHCVQLFFLITVFNPWFGELKTLIVADMTCFPIVAEYKTSAAQQSVSPLSDSPLYDVPYIFNSRQIWTVGRSVKHTHSVFTNPHSFMAAYISTFPIYIMSLH